MARSLPTRIKIYDRNRKYIAFLIFFPSSHAQGQHQQRTTGLVIVICLPVFASSIQHVWGESPIIHHCTPTFQLGMRQEADATLKLVTLGVFNLGTLATLDTPRSKGISGLENPEEMAVWREHLTGAVASDGKAIAIWQGRGWGNTSDNK